jgi:hypothetical protein
MDDMSVRWVGVIVWENIFWTFARGGVISEVAGEGRSSFCDGEKFDIKVLSVRKSPSKLVSK